MTPYFQVVDVVHMNINILAYLVDISRVALQGSTLKFIPHASQSSDLSAYESKMIFFKSPCTFESTAGVVF